MKRLALFEKVPPAIAERARARIFAVVVHPLQAFLRLEAASGILLVVSALVAIAWANLHAASYLAAFEFPIVVGAGGAVVTFTLRALVNDGLMAVFFFVVGMEIKRELVAGELNSVSKASLPAIAALGGMVVPASIFLAFTWGRPEQRGWGIPIATDIAFCVGILTLLKNYVPHALVVFVTALAIFDDIGGILIIAIFYGHGLEVFWLLSAVALAFVLFQMSRSHVVNGLAYAAMGAALWFALHHGGIHPTIAGVLLGLAIPARPQRAPRDVLRELAAHAAELDRNPPDEELEGAEVLAIEEKLEDLQAPVNRFVHLLHPPVAFVIMPLFALANSGVSLEGAGIASLTAPVALGTAIGLFIGKQLGIFGATILAVKLRLAGIPGGASRMKLFGVSIISGIGFTVSLFIAALAYPEAAELLAEAKMGILLGSFAAGVVGFLVLRLTQRSAELTP